MASIKKFVKGLYEYTNVFRITKPTEPIPDPNDEIRILIPYRGVEGQQGDAIKATDINLIQQNGTIVTKTIPDDSLGQGIDGYELVDYENEQGLFEGLKLKVFITKTNLYNNVKLTKNGDVYNTVKSLNESLVSLKSGDLLKNKYYDFVYQNNAFILQNVNKADENNYGTITEARIKELAAAEVLKVTNIYVPIPIGGIYISTNNVNPNMIWKNTTWEEFGQGKVLIGQDTTNTNFNTLGKTGGVYDVILNVNQIPSHNHTTDAQGNHAHYVNPNGNHSHIVNDHAHYVPPHQHVSPWGNNTKVYNPPWGIWGNNNQVGSNGLSDYDNCFGMTSPTDLWTHGSQPGTNVAGWHDHSTNAAGNHAHNISATGGNQAHTNIQPYITVKIWKRLT